MITLTLEAQWLLKTQFEIQELALEVGIIWFFPVLLKELPSDTELIFSIQFWSWSLPL